MGCLSLRAVISALASTAVALVAVMSVVVLLLATRGAVNRVGQDLTTQLVQISAIDAGNVLRIPGEQLQTTRLQFSDNFRNGGTEGWPSSSNARFESILGTALRAYYGVNLALRREDAVLVSFVYFFADDSRYSLTPEYVTGDTMIFTDRPALPYTGSPGDRPNATLAAQQELIREVRGVNVTTNEFIDFEATEDEYIRELHSNYTSTPATTSLGAGGAWEVLSSLTAVLPHGSAGMVAGRIGGSLYLMALVYLVPTYVAYDARGFPVGSPIAYSTAYVPLLFLSRYLQRITAGSSFASVVDTAGLTVARHTGDTDFLTIRQNATQSSACIEVLDAVTAAPLPEVTFMCRTRFTVDHPSFENVPLSWVIDGRDTASNAGKVRVETVDGERYFVGVSRIQIPLPGPGLFALLSIPEADVLGSLTTSTNVAFAIGGSLSVAAAIALTVAVSLLLRPLNSVATVMEKTAALDFSPSADVDDAERADSIMAEVALLQQASAAMRAEIHRVHTFIPAGSRTAVAGDGGQSPRAAQLDARSVLSPSSAGGGQRRASNAPSTPGTLVSAASGETAASRRRRRQRHIVFEAESSGRARGGDEDLASLASLATPASTSGLTVLGKQRWHRMLQRRNVSNLAVEVTFAFPSAIQEHQHDAAELRVTCVSAAVDFISRVIADSCGVVVRFDGDQVLATFNSTGNEPRHAALARVAARQLVVGLPTAVAEVVPEVDETRVTCGLATGACLAGNTGSRTSKAFTVIGASVSDAIALQRAARVYGNGCEILASAACVAANGNRNGFVAVDILPLAPAKTARDRALRREPAPRFEVVSALVAVDALFILVPSAPQAEGGAGDVASIGTAESSSVEGASASTLTSVSPYPSSSAWRLHRPQPSQRRGGDAPPMSVAASIAASVPLEFQQQRAFDADSVVGGGAPDDADWLFEESQVSSRLTMNTERQGRLGVVDRWNAAAFAAAAAGSGQLSVSASSRPKNGATPRACRFTKFDATSVRKALQAVGIRPRLKLAAATRSSSASSMQVPSQTSSPSTGTATPLEAAGSGVNTTVVAVPPAVAFAGPTTRVSKRLGGGARPAALGPTSLGPFWDQTVAHFSWRPRARSSKEKARSAPHTSIHAL